MIAATSLRASRDRTRRSARGARSAAGITAAEREALVNQHVGLVHHVARKLAAHLSTAADLDDMVSAGAFGLVQAVDSFDRARGLSFSTYAVPRIRGAILDELRRQDHVPRNVRRRTREVSRARDALVARLRRAPTVDELSRHLRVPSAMLLRWELDAEGATMCSMDQPARRETASATLAESMTDDRAPSVDDRLTHEREVERLRAAITTLKEQERTVLALSYFEELKLHEIAEVLGLSVCRISQIRTAALEKLRVALSGLRAA